MSIIVRYWIDGNEYVTPKLRGPDEVLEWFRSIPDTSVEGMVVQQEEDDDG